MSGLSSAPYDLGRSSGLCAATGRALAPGDAVVAALVEREADDGLDRLDYSLGAWDEGARPERLFCFWRRHVADPNVKPKPFIDDEELLALFDQLAEAEQDRQLAFRFILALILIRKRLLKHVGSSDADARPVMLVRRKGADAEAPPIEVEDPGMTAEAVEAATEQLSLAMRGDG